LVEKRGSVLMDKRHGYGFRLVSDGLLESPWWPGVTVIDLKYETEVDGCAAQWLAEHRVHAALLRPDHYVYGTAQDARELEVLGKTLRHGSLPQVTLRV
jgi:3-(3-hydroxy-phenyl)propionate hydroxylase